MADTKIIHDCLKDKRNDYIKQLCELYARLSLIFWEELSSCDINCTFCERIATHCNQEIKEYAQLYHLSSKYCTDPLYVCESCMYDLETENVNLVNPNGHALSRGLHELIRNWINHNCYTTTTTAEFFEKNGIADNLFFCCQKCSKSDKRGNRIAISVCGTYVAYERCILNHGFKYDESTVACIAKYLKCHRFIDSFRKFPKYTPPVSGDDKDRLNKFVHDYLHTFDLSEIYALASMFNKWIQVYRTRNELCCFYLCDRRATMYNKYIKKHSCNRCYTYIQRADITSPTTISSYPAQSYLIREMLHDKLDEIFHIKTKASVLYDKYEVQYHRCILCKKIVESDADVAVTNLHFAHVNCLGMNVKNKHSIHNKFHSTVPLDDIMKLPNFDLNKLLRLIHQ